uniref:Uncharacterized protein n=1 Tax=Oryza barthii TaxID=65489 RepID=A0A0D3HW86_9ORYZ
MASPRAQLSRQKGVGSVDGRIEQSYQGCGAGQKLKQEVAALVMPTRELTATSFINPILKMQEQHSKRSILGTEAAEDDSLMKLYMLLLSANADSGNLTRPHRTGPRSIRYTGPAGTHARTVIQLDDVARFRNQRQYNSSQSYMLIKDGWKLQSHFLMLIIDCRLQASLLEGLSSCQVIDVKVHEI